jgi:hypothetical protein
MWPFSRRNKDESDEMVNFQGKMVTREVWFCQSEALGA